MKKDDIVRLLMTNDKAIVRALIVLNDRQTETERQEGQTKYNNGEGFTPADAHVGTSMANFAKAKGYLTPKQIAYWKRTEARGNWRICKYAGQLLEIAKQKQLEVKNDS